MRRPPWWHLNRWWLLLVVPAAVAMVAGSSYRVALFWYDAGLHHTVATSAPGGPVSWTEDYSDAFGATSRTFTVRLTGTEVLDTVPDEGVEGEVAPPDGAQAIAADLSFEADPDQSLDGCFVALVDQDGRRYEIPPGSGQPDPCVPADHEGPGVAITRDHPRGYVVPGAERPATWTVAPVFVVPDGARITQVLVWWSRPDHLVLLPPA